MTSIKLIVYGIVAVGIVLAMYQAAATIGVLEAAAVGAFAELGVRKTLFN